MIYNCRNTPPCSSDRTTNCDIHSFSCRLNWAIFCHQGIHIRNDQNDCQLLCYIIINILILITKNRTNFVRLWSIGAAIQILTSTALFVILVVQWRGEYIVEELSVLIMFPVHLLFRCLVLYFCLRFTSFNFSTTAF